MKIAYVIDTLEIGGAERVAVDLANLMADDGHKIAMIVFNDKGTLKNSLHKNVIFFNIGRNNKYSLAAMLKFSRYIKSYDIVHVHMRHVLKYVMLVKWIFHFNAKVVFHDHYGKVGIDNKVPFFLGMVLKQADAYVGVDRQLCHWALREVGMDKNKIWRLPNVIVPKFTSNNSHKTSQEIESTVNLILVSNFKREKNIEFAINIMKQLSSSKDKRYKLDIFGKITDKDYFNEITALIDRYKIQEFIRFITDCDTIQKYLSHYDLALHAAVSESGPLVLMEYLAQGLPFISYRTGEVVAEIEGDMPELIMNNWNELEWVERINRILSPTSKIDNISLKQLFQRHFSTQEYVKQCNTIYNAIY